RRAVARDPDSAEAHRNLGLALAQQGKLPEALHHLTLGVPDQAADILCSVLRQSGRLPEALAGAGYWSRGYTRADQWLGHARIACDAAHYPRAAAVFGRAHRLDPAG